jgi:hypothetical protein
MKNYFLSALLLLCAISMNAQDSEPQQSYNEIKINGLYLVLGAFDVTYERTLNEESGLGLNVFLPFDSDINESIRYYVSPYYRMYFGKKQAAGFFVEGFGMLNSTNRDIDVIFDDDEDDFRTDFALGIGIGGKWVTNRGLIGEIGFGVGRNLIHNDTESDFVGKVNITLGYRF